MWKPGPPHKETRAPRAVWLLLAFALLTTALVVAALAYLHEAAVRSGKERAGSLVHVIAEQTTRTLQAVDTRLQLAVSRLEALESAGALDEPSARAVLRAQLKDLPFVRAMWVLDMEGRITHDSDAGNIGVSLADREYFRVYSVTPATEFHLGPLVRSRAGTWLMNAARPLRTRDGAVKGVIVAAIEPPFFQRLWQAIDLGAGGGVALLDRKGQLMALTPPAADQVGRDLSQRPLFTQMLPQAPHGVYVRLNSDGVERVIAYRLLETYPQLLVAVGIGYAEMLAPWRRFAALTAGVWGLALLAAGALSFQLRRQAHSRRHSERQFRELAQAMPQIVFIAGPRGLLQFINQRWVEATGRRADDARGTGWQQWVHADDLPATVDVLLRMLERGSRLQHELRLRHRDGSYRWQLMRAEPIRDESGAMVCWYGTATDIDELKQAQARLVEQAEQLHLAGHLASLGSWRLDVAAQRVSYSEEAAAILDLPPGLEPAMQEVIAMYAPGSLARGLHLLQDCLEHGKPYDTESEVITPKGRRVWLRSIAQPVFDAGGKVVAVQGAQQDITVRMRLIEEIRQLNAGLEDEVARRTAELAQQEALFRTLAEQAPLPFWTADSTGSATFFSRAWYELAGGEPPQWHGHGWMALVHPDDAAASRENWKRSIATGAPYTGTRRLRSHNGTYHTTTYRAEPVRSPAGEIVFWVGIDTDITDIVANESALRLANAQLEAYAYSVSHDLQSPLQRLVSFSRLLEEELAQVEGKARHYLQRMRANADAMTQLIDGLLALARVTEVEVIRSVVNVSELATEILERLQHDGQRRVRWRVEPGLAVIGDARLMRSVLENLIGNAWKFTAERADAEIVVGVVAERGEYFVRDNGAGFDMAYAERLFGSFQRLHDADRFPGTGIGLATVARAISRQDGRIWAHGEVDGGATFYFTLPPA